MYTAVIHVHVLQSSAQVSYTSTSIVLENTCINQVYCLSRYERSADLQVAGRAICAKIDDVLDLQDEVTQQIVLRTKV